jgi:hypothetical protein
MGKLAFMIFITLDWNELEMFIANTITAKKISYTDELIIKSRSISTADGVRRRCYRRNMRRGKTREVKQCLYQMFIPSENEAARLFAASFKRKK